MQGSLGLLKMAGFKPDDVPMIPASSLNGDNVFNKSDKCPWYKGPTLFEAINATPMPSKPSDKALRLPIQDVYKIPVSVPCLLVRSKPVS